MSTNILAQTTATPKILAQAQLSVTANATFATVPASSTWAIKSAAVYNATGTQYLMTLDVVPSGQTSAATRRLVSMNIAAGETLDLSWLFEGMVLSAGDFLAAWAGAAASLTLTITGVEAS
jgi:hypothetical protein